MLFVVTGIVVEKKLYSYCFRCTSENSMQSMCLEITYNCHFFKYLKKKTSLNDLQINMSTKHVMKS